MSSSGDLQSASHATTSATSLAVHAADQQLQLTDQSIIGGRRSVSTITQGTTNQQSVSGAAADSSVSPSGSSVQPPPAPRCVACHDCASLAALWSLGKRTNTLEPPRLTGASQAQSPSEDDPGDGKSNELVQSCPAFRNETGGEPTIRFALNRHTIAASTIPQQTDAVPLQTWHREVSASEAGVLENLSNVYLGGRLCASRQSQVIIEPIDPGAYFYRHCFAGRAHQNYFGTDPQYGPVALSVVREKIAPAEAREAGLISNALYRMIIRISDQPTIRVTIPEDSVVDLNGDGSAIGTGQSGSGSAGGKPARVPLRDLIELVLPSLQLSVMRLAVPVPRTEELLLKNDEQPIYTKYKIGVLLCKDGQASEEDMYNNELSTPAFDEFLDMLGNRVRLKGFDGYKGGLDTRGDTTGTHSVYTTYQQHQIMFHVSTMLPFTPSNRQQLARKRHIGNDMVTIVFQEPGAQAFSPITVRSHFQHVFIVVRVQNPCTDHVTYSVAVCRARDVPAFGPAVPTDASFPKSKELRDFLLTKVINAESGVHRSSKFASMSARTQREVLRDLVENHSTQHPAVESTKITSRLLGSGGANKKGKDRRLPKLVMNECFRGALSWGGVQAEDYSRGVTVPVVVGLSADSLVLLAKPEGDVLFATPTHSVIGWHVVDKSIRVYHDHGAVLVCKFTDKPELSDFVDRLRAVTRGCDAQEMTLRRNSKSSYEFHLQEEGIITEVAMYSSSWQSGLRQGSRFVEIGGVSISTLSYQQMLDLLKHAQSIRALVVPPSGDGSPRRGCEDAHCPAVMSATTADATDASVTTGSNTSSPAIGRTPPSYQQVQASRRQRESPSGKTDLGYESGTWTSTTGHPTTSASASTVKQQAHEAMMERRKTMPDWNIEDTLSSSGSASSELSSGGDLHTSGNAAGTSTNPQAASTGSGALNPVQKRRLRMNDVKKHHDKRPPQRQHRYRSEPDIASDVQQHNTQMHGGPPLPPRTYKPKLHDYYTMADVIGQMDRTHSEELMGVSASPLHPINNISHDDHSITVESARGAEIATAEVNQQDGQKRSSFYEWNSNVVEAAARVLANNPTLGSCQLRLQAALQRVKTLETQVERLTVELEQERRSRQDLMAEVGGLREDKRRLELERERAESELKHFTSWVCSAVDVQTPVADV